LREQLAQHLRSSEDKGHPPTWEHGEILGRKCSFNTYVHNVRLNWVNRDSRDLRWRCGCLFTVSANRAVVFAIAQLSCRCTVCLIDHIASSCACLRPAIIVRQPLNTSHHALSPSLSLLLPSSPKQ